MSEESGSTIMTGESSEIIMSDLQTLRASILDEIHCVTGLSMFAVEGVKTAVPLPGISVHGMGPLPLPLDLHNAELLMSKARQSPFGKGDETLVDTKVRNSFELDPSQFSIENPAWPSFISGLLDTVCPHLGLKCGRQNITAELYKLLLYKEGAFFRSHQDSEKSPGMFGTLVVSLPSPHEGGQVLLKHHKKTGVFDSSEIPLYHAGYAAWYSDVFHQVQKVTRGYRLVLTYNLIQKFSNVLLKAPDITAYDRLCNLLREYDTKLQADDEASDNWPNYLALRLQHTYSKAGLRLSTLRGEDADRVLRLKAVCDKLGFGLFFALKEKVLVKDDDSDREDEVLDRAEQLKYVFDLDGLERAIAPEYTKDSLLEEDIATDDDEHDESDHEGWTGNAGAPASYWYRTSLVLIVPPSRKIDFILDTGKSDDPKRLEILRELRDQVTGQEKTGAAALKRFCRVCIEDHAKPLRESLYYSSSAPLSETMWHHHQQKDTRIVGQVAITALEMDWFPIYCSVPMDVKFRPEVLVALGQFLASRGQDHAVWPLMKAMLEKQEYLQIRFSALLWIGEGLSAESPADATKSAFHDVASASLLNVLRSSLLPNKGAGVPLVQCILQYGEGSRDAVLDYLRRCPTPTKMIVVKQLEETVSTGSGNAHDLLEAAIACLWTSPFRLDGVNIRYTPGHVFVTCDELTSALFATARDSRKSCSLRSIFKCLREAHQDISSDYAKSDYLPFLEMVCRREPGFPWDTNSADMELVAAFIKHAFCTVIVICCGREPQLPATASVPRRNWCPCYDCRQVNDFLADPVDMSLEYRARQEIRRHLDISFSPGPDYEYSIDQIPYGKSQKWRITKTPRAAHSRKHASWRARVEELKERLSKVASAKDSLLSPGVLGPRHYQGIMSCTVEGLMEGRKTRKREAGGVEDNASKRAKGPEHPGEAEVIDLT
ncbi:hypothetical protein GGR56DRAFT_590546 [Xylariaceae sp. FL0804]|nr:hypothetical protein GGR56DRAFT_590546 [Xylariaceae sp. FL0804]